MRIVLPPSSPAPGVGAEPKARGRPVTVTPSTCVRHRPPNLRANGDSDRHG